MKHVVSNFILSKLPVHVVASHVMPLLDLRDLVTLDSARAMNGGGLLQEVQSLMPLLRLPRKLDRFVAEWFLNHDSVIHSWDTHAAGAGGCSCYVLQIAVRNVGVVRCHRQPDAADGGIHEGFGALRVTCGHHSFLLTLTQYCRNLSRLCVTKCSQFTEAAVVQLIHRSTRLTDLEVYRDRISPATGAAQIAEKRLYKLKVTQWS
jgi:hypothetical protein